MMTEFRPDKNRQRDKAYPNYNKSISNRKIEALAGSRLDSLNLRLVTDLRS